MPLLQPFQWAVLWLLEHLLHQSGMLQLVLASKTKAHGRSQPRLRLAV